MIDAAQLPRGGAADDEDPDDQDPQTVEVMGVRLDALTMDQTIDRLRALIAAGKGHNHLSINAAKLVAAIDDPAKREEFNRGSVISADGQSVVWAARILGQPLPERVAGIDVMERLVEVSAREGQRICLLGATAEVVARVESVFRARGANVVGAFDGYWRRDGLTDRQMAERIGALDVDILFVALPSPMKEDFIYGHAQEIGAGLSVGVGGSFDVLAGRTRRAPAVMQRLGLEWLHRLSLEPRRLFRRYAVGNIRFLYHLGRERLRRGR